MACSCAPPDAVSADPTDTVHYCLPGPIDYALDEVIRVLPILR